MITVDGGDLFWKKEALPAAEREQRLLKARLHAQVVGEDLDVFVPGEGDFALGVASFGELTAGWPVLAGNLQCGERSWPLTRVVKRGERQVGVVGVVGDSLGEIPGCALTQDPSQALQAGLAELPPVDMVLVVAHVGGVQARELEKLTGYDFLLNGHTRLWREHPVQLDSGAWSIGAGSRGKKLGVARLRFVDGASGWRDLGATDALESKLALYRERVTAAQENLDAAQGDAERQRAQRGLEYNQQLVDDTQAELAAATTDQGALRHLFSSRLVELDSALGDDPATMDLVIATRQAVAAVEQRYVAPTETLAMGPFAGSAACQRCHPAQQLQWRSTGHASAYGSLTADQRHLDQSCYSCHVTGAFHPEGPQRPADVGLLKDVGCEACHGPGAAHARAPASGQMQQPQESTCRACHDGERDEGRFELEAYLERVTH